MPRDLFNTKSFESQYQINSIDALFFQEDKKIFKEKYSNISFDIIH